MKIKELELKNFRRFTDLSITDIPQESRLILLIGSNGSGKSSVFDAFEMVNSWVKESSILTPEYYKKQSTATTIVKLSSDTERSFSYMEGAVSNSLDGKNSFYGRTSFRQVPRLTRRVLGASPAHLVDNDSDRPRFFIDKDDRFENDLEAIMKPILEEVFIRDASSKSIREKYIDPINTALENIFGASQSTKLSLISIVPPLEGKIAQVIFRKGASENIHYNSLSAGEKEVINILFNLSVRRTNYTDSIYFFDEIDLHLNTAIQYNLLKEITENWIPYDSQLWIASHSLGFIDYARDYQYASIFDFDDLDFDQKQILKPSNKLDAQIYEIAVNKDFMSKFFQHKKIIIPEGKDLGFYNDIGLDNTVFLASKNKNEVFNRSRAENILGLIDRDFLSDGEIVLIKKIYPNIRILPYYSIENLFYHPENLSEYCKAQNIEFDKVLYLENLIKQKSICEKKVIVNIRYARDRYPFFKEEVNRQYLKEFGDNYPEIQTMIDSLDFETYYKVFPIKDYLGTFSDSFLKFDKKQLVKTKWFKDIVERAIV